MKTVFDQMRESGAEAKMASFIVKQKMDYAFKRKYAEIRAWEFYNAEEIAGNVYCAVGGLDSITLFLFLHSLGIDCPGVSVSHLEDISIQRVHKALGITCLKSAKKPDGGTWTMPDVVREFGYPVLSKEKAAKIDLLQNPTDKNKTVRHAIITGETGEYGGYQKNSRMKLPQKWLNIFGGADEEGAALGYQAAPFRVSAKCCYYLKEKPCDDYAKQSGNYPYIGLMASEGGRREKALKLHGCNYISKTTKRSCPFAIFSRDDLLHLTLEMDAYYHEHWQEFNPDIHLDTIVPEIYGTIQADENGKLDTTGAKRTGCMLCGFGIHMEKRPHRFDRIREKNKKQWEYLMYTVGWGKVLDYIGIGWEDEPGRKERPLRERMEQMKTSEKNNKESIRKWVDTHGTDGQQGTCGAGGDQAEKRPDADA